jgi:hypothetical protein
MYKEGLAPRDFQFFGLVLQTLQNPAPFLILEQAMRDSSMASRTRYSGDSL